MLIHYYLVGAPLEAKQEFAASMIAKEQKDYRDRDLIMSEDNWGELPREDFSRKFEAGNILRGMVIRGRMQAAVFDTFMDLCLQGVCSLSSLEHPMDWNYRSSGHDCHRWIVRMLRVFSCFHVDMDLLQEKWGIPWESRWHYYDIPFVWLGTMIARSFNSIDAVFNTIRRKGQLGPVRADDLKTLEEHDPPNPAWQADLNINCPKRWYGSGTFACWLPENINASIAQLGVYDGVMALSKDFHMRLSRTEMHYAVFFDINRDAEYAEDADVEHVRLD
jgi:hypothetical protein